MPSYILIDKVKKEGYTGKDRRAISKSSGVSENTLKSWSRKGSYWETMEYILCTTESVVGKKGGFREKKQTSW